MAYEAGVATIRVATHCTEADVAEQHIGLSRQLRLDTVGFLMMAHLNSPEGLAAQGKLMESYGAQAIYVTDSAGYMLPDDVREQVRALREVLVQRDPAGIAPQLEVRILEATELTLRRRAADFELDADRERIELNLLRGAALDATLAVAPGETALPARPALADLMAAANTNNFELRTRAAEWVQQGFRVDLARNERWPRFEVGPVVSQQDGGTRDQTIGIGVSFPLPLWRNRESNVAAAEARRQQAAASLEAARRDVERRVVTAARGYDTRLAELANWRADAVARFAEAAELADRHYRLGAVPATTYVVKPGDSLWTIAKKNHLTYQELASANNLKPNAALHEGQKLLIPSKVVPAAKSASAPATTKAGESAPSAKSPGESVKHVVKSGESLSTIAKKYGVRQGDIAVANNITDPQKIYLGMELIIPGWQNPAGKPAQKTGAASAPKSSAPAKASPPEIKPIFNAPAATPDASGRAPASGAVPVIKVDDTPAPAGKP
jgi:LysM repeat protein